MSPLIHWWLLRHRFAVGQIAEAFENLVVPDLVCSCGTALAGGPCRRARAALSPESLAGFDRHFGPPEQQSKELRRQRRQFENSIQEARTKLAKATAEEKAPGAVAGPVR
jgi:hypothetical protein